MMHSNPSNPFSLMDEIIDLLSKGELVATNNVPQQIASNGFPYCDLYVSKNTNKWHLDVAIAGYSEDEVAINYADNYFSVEFKPTEPKDDGNVYIKKGISKRAGTAKVFIDSTKYSINDTEVEWNKRPGILSISVPVDKRYVAPKSFSIDVGKKSTAKSTTKKSNQ